MKKLTAIILLISMLMLFGCENVEYIESTSVIEETSVNSLDLLVSELPTLSIPAVSEDEGSGESEGEVENEVVERTFTIVTNKASTFYPDESASGAIAHAVQERNRILLEKYGADLSVSEMSGQDLYDEVKKAYNANLEFCDMLSVSTEDSIKLYKMGLLYDMNSLPNFDLNSDFFDERNAKTLATNSTLYMLPDPTNLYYEDTYVLFYNRNLTKNGGFENIEDFVMKGEWTWDKFNEIARASSTAYDKSSANVNGDIFGFSAYRNESIFPIVMFASTGKELVGNTYKNPVELSLEVEDVENTCIELNKTFNVKGKLPHESNKAEEIFRNGRTVFFCNTLNYIYALRDGTQKGSEYGFLPMPKLNVEQDGYTSLVETDARVISVPKTVEYADDGTKEYISAMITATCAVGGTTTKKAFVESFIAGYLNDNSETVILETICDSAKFDFAYTFGKSIPDIAHSTTIAVSDYLEFGSMVSSTIRLGRWKFNNYSKNNFS